MKLNVSRQSSFFKTVASLIDAALREDTRKEWKDGGGLSRILDKGQEGCPPCTDQHSTSGQIMSRYLRQVITRAVTMLQSLRLDGERTERNNNNNYKATERVMVNSKARPRISAAGLFSVISLASVYTVTRVIRASFGPGKSPTKVDAQRAFNKRAGIKARSARSRMSRSEG